FPESYDTSALSEFLRAIKSGEQLVEAPVYSHLVYDVVPGDVVTVSQPDVLIVEGLNVLQSGRAGQVVSDFFDFSIFVDADEALIEQWYVERFLTLRESVFRNPDSYFRHFAELDEASAIAMAESIWANINAPNLRENIAPTRSRADLILTKGAEHAVERVYLRKT
ncbi:MAG: type I pantothenate kinase, partial [Acidimicrobiales bacterium]